jgi:hypothetical protein
MDRSADRATGGGRQLLPSLCTSYGLLAYPIREVFLRVADVRGFGGYYSLDVAMARCSTS